MSIPKKKPEEVVIHWRIDKWFPELSPEVLSKFKHFHEELLRINQKTVALIPPKSIENADSIHFADSIMAWRIIEPDLASSEIYDLGSGNGFPGLIFASMCPSKNFHLVEIEPKRADFLRKMVSELELDNVNVEMRQVESFEDESLSCAVCRNFLPLTPSLLVTRKAFVSKGVFYHLRGNDWPAEIASLPTQLCSFWLPGLLGEYRLPETEASSGRLVVIKTEKI